jgi:hypothetical protein
VFFADSLRGYHLINTDPVKEHIWEAINTEILEAASLKVDRRPGSHKSGKDIVSDLGSFSNKTAKYKGDILPISSYRLTKFFSAGNVQMDSIVSEINKRKNFGYYSIIARAEDGNKITYEWYIIDANHRLLNPGSYRWEKSLGRNGIETGWKTDIVEGSFMTITHSMSSQLWIHLKPSPEMKRNIVAHCEIDISQRATLTHIQLFGLYHRTPRATASTEPRVTSSRGTQSEYQDTQERATNTSSSTQEETISPIGGNSTTEKGIMPQETRTDDRIMLGTQASTTDTIKSEDNSLLAHDSVLEGSPGPGLGETLDRSIQEREASSGLSQDEDVQISDEEDEENFSWGFQESSDNSTPEEEGSPQWSHEEEEESPQWSHEEEEESPQWSHEEEEESPQWSHEEEDVPEQSQDEELDEEEGAPEQSQDEEPDEEVSEESFVGGGNGIPVRSVG